MARGLKEFTSGLEGVKMRFNFVACGVFFLGFGVVHAQPPEVTGYLTPPDEIVDLLAAPRTPDAAVSPSLDVIALLDRIAMPPIAELARPVRRLAGRRIDPLSYAEHKPSPIRGLRFVSVDGGREIRVDLAPGMEILPIGFSFDGSRFAFASRGSSELQLWIADPSTGRAVAVRHEKLNGTMGAPCTWTRVTVSRMLCRFVVENQAPSARPAIEPNVRETDGSRTPVRTYRDLLRHPQDAEQFSRYFTSQLGWLDLDDGHRTAVGAPAIYGNLSISPNGDYLVVERLVEPFSYLVPVSGFRKRVEIWTNSGDVVWHVGDVPSADTVPRGAPHTGPRSYAWNPTEPATAVWFQAQNGDESSEGAVARGGDRIMVASAPFVGSPAVKMTVRQRLHEVSWTDEGVAIVVELDLPSRRARGWALFPGSEEPHHLSDVGLEDIYNNPGTPLQRPGRSTVLQVGHWIYLGGYGASLTGARPFIDRFNLHTREVERLFQSAEGYYEEVISPLTPDGGTFLTRRESQREAPTYVVRSLTPATVRELTATDARPAGLGDVSTRLLTYKRSDGVALSATLRLPADYRPGTRLPVVLWPYPRQFYNPDMAGQIIAAPNRFARIYGPSPQLLLTQGYAVLEDPRMPIVGQGDISSRAYIDQLVASTEAAVETIVEMGVADPSRIAVAGHSYGAFTVANLLIHTDLFRAGFASGGAYNRSLTPFGFQAEDRTFWEAPGFYMELSPFSHADEITAPLLLVHGGQDENAGTHPMQSERFFRALSGNGAVARYVELPYEGHSYVARESVLHVVAEMVNWFNRHLGS